MRVHIIGAIFAIVLLSIPFFNVFHVAQAQQGIPFDGLRLVYFAETTQVVKEFTGIYASSLVTLLFHDVSDASSKMDVNVNGVITRDSEQQPQNVNMTVDFPTDRDTLVFLRNGGQDNLTIYAGPAGFAIPSIPGLTIDLTRPWNLHDKPEIRTPIGTFSGYRYHTAIKSIPFSAGTIDLDVYASYETFSQVLMAGEVWATVNGQSRMIIQTQIRDANLPSGTPTARCLIATATYGSELTPQVQFLREFRDQKILKTFAGSNFMTIFNLWYYSFSPSVAQVIRANPELRAAMQLILYPLILILQLSAGSFGALSFQPEVAALVAGLVASSIIGAFYLSWPILLMGRRFRGAARRFVRLLILVLGVATLCLAIAEIFSLPLLAAPSSAAVVLAALFLGATLPFMFLDRVFRPLLLNRRP